MVCAPDASGLAMAAPLPWSFKPTDPTAAGFRRTGVLNVCPHEFAPVCLGRLGGTTLPSAPGEWVWGREGEILACPWHGWEFDLFTGACLTDRRRLRMYEVTVEDDQIIVIV